MDGIVSPYLWGFVPGGGNKKVELRISQDYFKGGRGRAVFIIVTWRREEVFYILQRDFWHKSDHSDRYGR